MGGQECVVCCFNRLEWYHCELSMVSSVCFVVRSRMGNVGMGTVVSVVGSLGTGCCFFAVLLPLVFLAIDFLAMFEV